MDEVKPLEQAPVEKPEGVENQQPIAPEVDPEVVIGQLLDANKKLAQERENMRRGMLKAKGKWFEPEPKAEEPELEETNVSAMEDLIKEQVSKLDTAYIESNKQLEEETKKLARENKELKKSLANKSQVSSSAQGASNVEQPVKNATLSDQQLDHLKNALKWDDKKIEAFKQNRLR